MSLEYWERLQESRYQAEMDEADMREAALESGIDPDETWECSELGDCERRSCRGCYMTRGKQ